MLLPDRLTQSVLKVGRAERIGSASRSNKMSLDLLGKRAIEFLLTHNLHLIRASLAVIYLWFGALKVIGPTSNFQLVADTAFWFPVPPEILVPWMGLGEIIMAFGLLFGSGWVLRVSLFLFFFHMAGTFLVLVLLPDVSYQGGNPLFLTKIGEYVIKNIVFVAGGLVVLVQNTGSEQRK